MRKIFVTGTDTEIGKTYVSTRLLRACTEMGLSTLGIKPIATGCTWKNNCLLNDDALQLQQASSLQLPYALINPLAFEPAIAPHIAAEQVQCELNMRMLKQLLQPSLEHAADVFIIEGFGGWYAPLNHRETMADFVKQQDWPVILVVGVRLGCINHAILTERALQHDGIKVLGWIANCVTADMLFCKENIAALQAFLSTPYLGTLDHGSNAFRDFGDATHLFN